MNARDPSCLTNAILAGLVSITAPCNNVDKWAALVIGLFGGILYIISTKLLIRAKIDDPIQATQIHGFCGFWGVFSVGIFDKDTGLIYSGSGKQLTTQLIGAAALSIWSSLFCWIFFTIMSQVKRFRVAPIYEIVGIDLLMHASIHDLSLDAFIKNNNPGMKKDTESFAHLRERIEAIQIEHATEIITSRTNSDSSKTGSTVNTCRETVR